VKAIAANEPEGVRGFNLATVYLLGRLYGSFPEPIDFRMLREHIVLAIAAVDQSGEARQAEATIAKYVADTIRWLSVEGYLRYEGRNVSGDYMNLELTEKAFRALEQVPTSIRRAVETRKSLGELMREASVEQGAAFAGAVAGEMVKNLLGN
jgi:hypothetical protein